MTDASRMATWPATRTATEPTRAAQPARSPFAPSPCPPDPARFWRKLGAFAGPGYLVAVGYMDPGNWATDLAGGSAFGYTLLSVILLSNLMAMVLQALAAKLGIVTGLDLAQACRAHYSPPVRMALWVLCELAIIACDLAEVIGTAIALQLLFGIPLVWGVCLTALDVLLILLLQQRGFRKLEAFIIALLIIIAGCFAVELALSQPSIAAIAARPHPARRDRHQPGDALHRDRHPRRDGDAAQPLPPQLDRADAPFRPRPTRGKREAIRFATIDSTIALSLALFINASILILAASTFHAGRAHRRRRNPGRLSRCSRRCWASGAASTLFAVALLASGQNSTITATLAGQIVMEGFLNLRLPPVAAAAGHAAAGDRPGGDRSRRSTGRAGRRSCWC